MTRFANDTLFMDNGITIGGIRIELLNALLSNATFNRNTAGDVSINVAASQNAIITFDVGGSVLKQINSLLSTTSNPAVDNNGNLLVTGTAPIPKGFNVTDITVAYSVQAGPLTSMTVRIDKNVFTAGANVITSILAVGQNGLSLANTANATTCALIKIPVTAGYDITDNDAMFIELNPVTPAGCTLRLYELFMHGTFNYN